MSDLTDEQKNKIEKRIYIKITMFKIQAGEKYGSDAVKKWMNTVLTDGSTVDMFEYQKFIGMTTYALQELIDGGKEVAEKYFNQFKDNGIAPIESPDDCPLKFKNHMYKIIDMMRNGTSPFSSEAIAEIVFFALDN